MARQRFVKPELFQHYELHRAEVVSGLPLIRAYIGLWTVCDRRGCFAWKPQQLKLNILPYDNLDFESVLTALESAGFVRSYIVDGRRFGYVPTVPRHQSFHKNERPDPLIPDPPKGENPPPEHSASTVQAPPQHSASTPVLTTALTTALSTTTASSTVQRTPPAAAGGKVDAVSIYARQSAIAANTALNAKFGESTRPLLPGNKYSLEFASDCIDAGVPISYVAGALAEFVARSSMRERPKALSYFTRPVIEAWQSDEANADAKRDGPELLAGAVRPKPRTNDGYLTRHLRELKAEEDSEKKAC